jgi:hypothetical protein
MALFDKQLKYCGDQTKMERINSHNVHIADTYLLKRRMVKNCDAVYDLVNDAIFLLGKPNYSVGNLLQHESLHQLLYSFISPEAC